MKRLWNRQKFFAKYGDWNVQRVGRRDGGLDPAVPPWDAPDLPPFAWEMAHTGDGDIHALADGWAEEDKALLPAWQDAAHRANRANRDAADAEAAEAAAEAAYKKEHGTTAPPTDRRVPLYWLLVAALSLAEVPLNEICFRVFGESDLLTAIFTLGVTGSVILCSHYLGVALGHVHQTSGKPRATYATFVVLLALVPLLVIASFAEFRAASLVYRLVMPATNAQPLLATQASSPPVPVFDRGFLFAAFFSFNAAIFLLALTASFFVHDASPDIVFRRRRARQFALGQLAVARRRLARARGRREKRHARSLALAHRTAMNVRRLLDAYRTHNLQKRRDRGAHEGTYPACFDKYVGPAIPEELETLRWPEVTPAVPVAIPVAAAGAAATPDYPASGDLLPGGLNAQPEGENNHARNGFQTTV